jgi:hypothetical protein
MTAVASSVAPIDHNRRDIINAILELPEVLFRIMVCVG